MDYFIGILNEVGEETLLEHCCKFITFSSVRPTTEQRELLMAKLEQDQRYADMRKLPPEPSSPRPPFQEPLPEVKPDTLMPNSCTSCGASFVDHGILACSEDICFYDRRQECQQIVLTLPTEDDMVQCDDCGIWEKASTAIVESDNWVQCDDCNAWHKIESTENLPEKWSCANIKKACRAPKAAERFWPAARAKRFAKHWYPYQRPNHMKALQLLASRRKLTLEQLLAMHPQQYLDNDYLLRTLMGPTCYWRTY
jgi:hypothetical protein